PHFHTANDLASIDARDAGSAMSVVGADWNLPALPGPCVDADGLERDGEQTARYLFAGCDDGVIFACVVKRRAGAANCRKLLNPAHQLVGLSGHGRNDHRHLMASVHFTFDVARDPVDAAEVGDGSSA